MRQILMPAPCLVRCERDYRSAGREPAARGTSGRCFFGGLSVEETAATLTVADWMAVSQLPCAIRVDEACFDLTDRNSRLQDLLVDALEVPPDQRPTFLRCQADDVLCREAASLLEAHSRSGDFLATLEQFGRAMPQPEHALNDKRRVAGMSGGCRRRSAAAARRRSPDAEPSSHRGGSRDRRDWRGTTVHRDGLRGRDARGASPPRAPSHGRSDPSDRSARGVGAAHAQECVHGDIKPSNLLLMRPEDRLRHRPSRRDR